MGRLSRFPKPEVERIPLSDGDWIEIKRKLNTGDSKRLEAAGLQPPIMVNSRIVQPIDWERYELERALIFLVRWSLHDENDVDMALDMDHLKAMELESFEEINGAITKFVLEQAQAKADLKNAQAKTKDSENSSKPNDTDSDKT